MRSIRVKQARAERSKKADAKRQNLDELEECESAFKRARLDTQKEGATLRQNNERIQMEGKRLREGKEKEMKTKLGMEVKQTETLPSGEDSPPEMGKFQALECYWC